MKNKEHDELLTAREAAALLKIKLTTLSSWRLQRIKLKYIKDGRLVRYLPRLKENQQDFLTFILT